MNLAPWRRESRRREDELASARLLRRAVELPVIPDRPAPRMPSARFTADGYEYPAVDAQWDPCGAGPIRPEATP